MTGEARPSARRNHYNSVGRRYVASRQRASSNPVNFLIFLNRIHCKQAIKVPQVSIAMINIVNKRNLGKKGFILFDSQLTVHGGRSQQKLKPTTEAEAMEKHWLLSSSSGLAQPNFLYSLGPPVQGWHHPPVVVWIPNINYCSRKYPHSLLTNLTNLRDAFS